MTVKPPDLENARRINYSSAYTTFQFLAHTLTGCCYTGVTVAWCRKELKYI